MNRKEDCIFLIGFMGSGKTKVGRVLAGKLGAVYLDTDEMIEEREGISISRIFEQYGEPYFRDLETQVLEDLPGILPEKPVVISVGGGLPVREENRMRMRRIGMVVFLTAREETLVGRLSGSRKRPLLQGADLRERIRSLSAVRLDLYLDAADWEVATDGKTPEAIAEEIIRVTGKDLAAGLQQTGTALDRNINRQEQKGEAADAS